MARYTTEKTPLGVRVYGMTHVAYLFFSNDPQSLFDYAVSQGVKNPVLGLTFDEWVTKEGLTAADFGPPMPDSTN